MGAYQHVKSPVTGDRCVIHMNCLYFHVFSRVFSHSAKTVFVTSMASPLRLSSGGHALQSLPKESWVNHESGAHQQLAEAALGFITQPSSHRNWKTHKTPGKWMKMGSPWIPHYPTHLTPKGSPMVQGFHLGHPSTGLVARARWMWIASFPAPTWFGMSGIWKVFHPSSSHILMPF